MKYKYRSLDLKDTKGLGVVIKKGRFLRNNGCSCYKYKSVVEPGPEPELQEQQLFALAEPELYCIPVLVLVPEPDLD
jgi:hypothetical protein